MATKRLKLAQVVDGDVLRRARIRALEHGTTVNALVRDYLETFVGPDEVQRALDTIAEIGERSQASSGPVGAGGAGTTCMSDRVFLDTNIFVYAVDNAEADKQELAQTVLRQAAD